MHQPGKWWVGLILIAPLWAHAIGLRTEPVEVDIASRARVVASELGDSATAINVEARGRDVLLEGLEFADGDGLRLSQAVDHAYGVRLVDARLERVREARPFEFAAAHAGDQFRLSGAVPSPAARVRVLALAKDAATGRAVIDNLAYATGAPAGFEAIVAYGMAEAAKLEDGSFTLVDSGYSIAGAAATSEIFEAAMAATQRLPAGATLAKVAILPPPVKPYRWDANSDGRSVTLSGVAPSEAVRGEIAGAAARLFPGRTIVSRMAIARGAPDGDFAGAAASALTELAKLTDGVSSMTDAELSIRGRAPATVTNAAVSASARASLPPPFTVGVVDIIAPYMFKVAKGGGRVVLTGFAPNNAARDDFVATAKAAFFGESLENELTIRGDAPVRFVETLKAMFPAFARLASGTLSAEDTVITVEGLAIYGKAVDQIKAELAGAIGSGFRAGDITIGVSPPPPALAVSECQRAFEGLLAKGRILFNTGSADLSKESLALLDHLIEVAQRCRDAAIEVAGHTDSVGDPESNLDLSKRRAEAVTSYMEESGIDMSRISSAGYGQTRPIASNDTPEGRTQNRRIEFVVK